MSTPEERFAEVYRAYASAYQRRFADWKEAATEAEARSVQNNVNSLEASYLRAAIAALNATGAAVEDAMQAAVAARDAVDAAYADAVSIADKIRLVAGGARAVGDLVKKAQGADSAD